MLMQTARPRVLLVAGTRPEAIKLAPVVLGLRRGGRVDAVLATTGQHREMTAQVLTAFGLSADRDLALGRTGHTLASLTAAAVTGMTELLADCSPNVVVVQGDTTTAFVTGLAAFYAAIPVAHVEAGLRSGDPHSPFPEEANRRLIGVVADRHLAPTWKARDNLLAEAVAGDRIDVTGNTVVDALRLITGRLAGHLEPPDPTVRRVLTDPRRIVLVTTHRRESWGPPMAEAMSGLAHVARHRPDTLFVLPMHPNPAVREVVAGTLSAVSNVVLTEPLDYLSFVALLSRAYLVLTDSGGLQEEAPSLGKPVLVMRENTERPEGVEAGTTRLIGTDSRSVVEHTLRLLDDPAEHARMAGAVNPYGDGRAAERCVHALEWMLDLRADRPQPFRPGSAADRPHHGAAASTRPSRRPRSLTVSLSQR